MRILIVGCKGFIGSHCLTHFSKLHETWGADIVHDYATPQYITIASHNPGYSDIFAKYNFDVCINCSGAASVPDSVINPEKDFYLNTILPFNLLNAIRKSSPDCRFLNLSSAAVYGNPEILPIKETAARKPVSPYGKHKKMAEDICTEFYELYNIKTCSVRIFSAYGEGLRKQLFWDLYLKAQQSNEVVLHGTGKESRDYIHVKEIIAQIECIVNHATFKADTINIASGNETLIENAVATFYNLSGWQGTVKYNGFVRTGDPINWCADISIVKSLGYEQKSSFEEGLTRYIAWIKENK